MNANLNVCMYDTLYYYPYLFSLCEVGDISLNLYLHEVGVVGVGQDCEGHSVTGRLVVLVGDLQREVVGTADQARENQHWLTV